MSDINKEKLFDYMDEKILDLHPFPRESSNFVEKCVLQDLKKSINSGKFDSKNVENSSLITTIESQKEEIEKLNGVIRTLGLTLENSIKGLKEISWDAEKASFMTLGGADNFRDFILDKSNSTLTEIARLSHELDK